MAAASTAAARGRTRGIAVALALLLSACTATPDNRQVSLPAAPQSSDMQPAAEREHQRILASYGGVYEDARLQGSSEKPSTGWWRRRCGRTSNTR